MLFIKGQKLPCEIILMLNLGLNIQTLILYTLKALYKCILFKLGVSPVLFLMELKCVKRIL